MADEAEEVEEAGGGSGGKGGGLVGMLLTALLAGLFGAAGTVAVQRSPLGQPPAPEVPAPAPEAGAAPAAEGETAEDFQQRLLSLEPVVVNIAGSGIGRFLKVRVELEADSVAAREELSLRMPQVKDALITLMSSKRIADVADFEGKVLLKEDLRDRMNELLTKGSVKSVLLTEFVVQ